VTLTRNGEDVTGRFEMDDDGVLVGLVDDLRDGDNRVRLVADHPTHGRRVAMLPVRNHPITGPVFSGPHQEPFICRTADAGLGEPIDDHCSIETRSDWRYFSQATQQFQPLDDPYEDYPPDTATTTTTDGATVPYVVRIESATINRGITRIAVLDDPAARGPEAPYEPAAGWNRKVVYQFGASCGVGRHQGVNSAASVLTGVVDVGGTTFDTGPLPLGEPGVPPPPVGDGYLVAHSTLTTFGVDCNQALSAETLMMVREHIIEQYGRFRFLFGNGASGGAIQQVTAMDNYPGLLDGGLPLLSYPDVVTTAMSVADCRLLLAVFQANPVVWNEVTVQAVTGHRTSQICRDWDLLFTDRLDPDTGCDSSVPAELIYHPEDNPDGVRCTLQDSLVNLLGIDPATGFANRPLDNVGVQYGRQALEDAVVPVDMFLDLNEQIGGLDIDGNIVDERMVMDPEVARRMYEWGVVTGRGGLAEGPVIFLSPYIDLVPVLGFHDAVRAYMVRERLRAHAGTTNTHAIWAGAPLPADGWPVMDHWLTDLTEARAAAGDVSPAGWSSQVEATRPTVAADACMLTGGRFVDGFPLPVDAGEIDGDCETLFAPLGSPRMVAGGPLSEDVLKCTLRPPDRSLDGVGFSDAQWERFTAIFADGVCDWTRPGVGEVPTARTWLSFADGPDDPQPIPNLVARTVALAAVDADPAPAATGRPLPATGGGLPLTGLVLLLGALLTRRR
jgi:hypothetical protein